MAANRVGDPSQKYHIKANESEQLRARAVARERTTSRPSWELAAAAFARGLTGGCGVQVLCYVCLAAPISNVIGLLTAEWSVLRENFCARVLILYHCRYGQTSYPDRTISNVIKASPGLNVVAAGTRSQNGAARHAAWHAARHTAWRGMTRPGHSTRRAHDAAHGSARPHRATWRHAAPRGASPLDIARMLGWQVFGASYTAMCIVQHQHFQRLSQFLPSTEAKYADVHAAMQAHGCKVRDGTSHFGCSALARPYVHTRMHGLV